MAASGQDQETGDGETFIEKYTKGVSAVDTILTLDRLRQEVAVKELLNARGKNQLLMQQQQAAAAAAAAAANQNGSQFMRKTMSVPNFSNVSSTSFQKARSGRPLCLSCHVMLECRFPVNSCFGP